jgi:Family of unknown function (DUF5682)
VATSVTPLGIRHHGPGSAGAVRRALDELQPDIVLLEAPQEAEALLDLAGDPGMIPPVALLAYVPDRPERAAFYPFASFSPEWIAITWAVAHTVPVRCIDLPAANSLAMQAGRVPSVDAIGQLAAVAGYDDPERWWEDVIEHRQTLPDSAGGDQTPDSLRQAPSSVATFVALSEAMAAVRAGEPSPVGAEALREASMRQAIRRAVADGFDRIVVVCGAWHVPALGVAFGPPGADRALVRGLPKTKVALTWVPWTHRRLASASGYGAGVTSPGWYAHVFATVDGDSTTTWFARSAALLRQHDIAVSPDHLIAATRLAQTLAVMRGRPRPGLAEVADAARAVLAGGRLGPLALIQERLVIGDEIGSVPASTPMVPLARDLAVQQKRCRLQPEATQRVIELDVRVPTGRVRSQLLYRLTALDVPWGRPQQSRGSTGTFRETWSLRWEPELSVRLIEASAYGATVQAAATARIVERASSVSSLGDLTALVELALLGDLPDAVAPTIQRLAGRAAVDADVDHLMDALGPLARVARYGDVRGTDSTALAATLDGLIVRICAGLAPAFASLDTDGAAAAADRLGATQASLALVDHPALADLWPRALEGLARQHGGHGVVQGRVIRLLLDSERWSGEQAGKALSRALSAGTPAAGGAAFVEGFLAGSGTVLLHDSRLLRLIDSWLARLDAAAFTDVVALLRRTFASFESAERRQLGMLIAGRGDGRPAAPYGWTIDEGRARRGLATVAMLLGATP